MQSETGIDWHVSGGEDVQTNKTISMSSMEAGKWMYSLLANYFKKATQKRFEKNCLSDRNSCASLVDPALSIFLLSALEKKTEIKLSLVSCSHILVLPYQMFWNIWPVPIMCTKQNKKIKNLSLSLFKR